MRKKERKEVGVESNRETLRNKQQNREVNKAKEREPMPKYM